MKISTKGEFKLIINKKEFDTRDYISVNKFEEYGISEDDYLLTAILVEKNEKIKEMSEMFY